MKIDWKEAPYWANFAAMDADGKWYWYALNPKLDLPRQHWERAETSRMATITPSLPEYTPWHESLQTRP